ncbi:MAG: hypothetical protein ACRDTH_17690 [Pseudonocardiaceae bacterium]
MTRSTRNSGHRGPKHSSESRAQLGLDVPPQEQARPTRGRTAVNGLTLDAGALVAIDHGGQDMRALLRRAGAHGWPIVIPTGALAQAWRGGARQARLAAFLGTRRDGPVLHLLDAAVARAAGELCGRTGVADVIDASVVLRARSHGHHVVTSDPRDLAGLDGTLPIVIV